MTKIFVYEFFDIFGELCLDFEITSDVKFAHYHNWIFYANRKNNYFVRGGYKPSRNSICKTVLCASKLSVKNVQLTITANTFKF